MSRAHPKYENICVTKFSRYLFSARSVWNVLLHRYAFWYVARVCSYLHSGLKLTGIPPSGCERHRMQNFFFRSSTRVADLLFPWTRRTSVWP